MSTKPWLMAWDSADVLVAGLGPRLYELRDRHRRGEVGPRDYFAMAGREVQRVEDELDLLFTTHVPPLHLDEVRRTHRRRREQANARLQEVCRALS